MYLDHVTGVQLKYYTYMHKCIDTVIIIAVIYLHKYV